MVSGMKKKKRDDSGQGCVVGRIRVWVTISHRMDLIGLDILAKACKRCCVWECLEKVKKSRAKGMGNNSGAAGVKREEGEWKQMKISVHPSFQYI